MSENINEIAGVEPSFKIDELKFNEKGLIPAIVQDHYSKKYQWFPATELEMPPDCGFRRCPHRLWFSG